MKIFNEKNIDIKLDKTKRITIKKNTESDKSYISDIGCITCFPEGDIFYVRELISTKILYEDANPIEIRDARDIQYADDEPYAIYLDKHYDLELVVTDEVQSITIDAPNTIIEDDESIKNKISIL